MLDPAHFIHSFIHQHSSEPNPAQCPGRVAGIHPRFKREVGRRLALALSGISSPTLVGCGLEGSSQIRLKFSVQSDALTLRWSDEDYNMTDWAVADSSSLMVCIGKPDGSTAAADCIKDAGLWASAVLRQTTKNDTLSVDLSQLPAGAKVLAVRYGWPLSSGADTCCPSKAVSSGMEPCVPAACPILTKKSALPANPFYATLESAKCHCMAPQQCDESA